MPKRQSIAYKAISLAIIGIFLYSDTIGWADQVSRTTLAPQAATQRKDFRGRFSAALALFSHEAVNRYIGDRIKCMLDASGDFPKEPRVIDGVDVYVIPIPELFRNTGQFAHIGLGRQYKRPVIYMDSFVYNADSDGRKSDKEKVLKHEISEIIKFEKIRKALGVEPGDMRDRIIRFIDKPDPDLTALRGSPDHSIDDIKKYPGRSYRQIAKEIHDTAESLGELYKKYESSLNAEAYVNELLTLYDAKDIYYDPETSRDINIAAHHNPNPNGKGVLEWLRQAVKTIAAQFICSMGGLGAYFGDKLEGLAAINDRGKDPGGKSFVEKNAPELRGKFMVSLSMEGNIPEAGYDGYVDSEYSHPDKDGFISVGIQPGYSHTVINHEPVKGNYESLIERGVMQKVFVGEDAIKVRAWDEDPNPITLYDDEDDPKNPRVAVEVYKINRGGTWSYILMSEVFDVLYPDGNLFYREDGPGDKGYKRMKAETEARRHRFTQEVVFGKAAFELIKRLDRKPDILHLNEAHTVVAAAQMRADKNYKDTAIVYTNHTLVPAGLERFSIGVMDTNVDRTTYVLGLPSIDKEKKEFEEFRSAYIKTDRYGQVFVDFCHAAIQLADVINAVSKEHAIATVKLFKTMYGDEFNKPVVGILNGSGESWKSDKLREWEEAAPAIDENTRELWENKLWEIHEENKKQAFKEIEKRTGVDLDPEKPTEWAVRRLVDYKSQLPMLKYNIHLMILDTTEYYTRETLLKQWKEDLGGFEQAYEANDFNTRTIADRTLDKMFKHGSIDRVYGLGMQVVAGWPGDGYMDDWVVEFKRWMELENPKDPKDPKNLKGKFVVVPSDAEFLKTQAIASDICLNFPRSLEEACGTSDQRTGLSGGVNIALKGAGPIEWIEEYDPVTREGSGFFIGSYVNETKGGLEADINAFYREAPSDIFEKAALAAQMFREKDKKDWKHLMLNSYVRANELVTARAMEERYATDVYVPAIRAKRNTRIVSEIAVRDYGDKAHSISGLKALENELPAMAEAGVRYVCLRGLVKNTGQPGEILDPRKIDEGVGSPDDLKDFIYKAHQPRQGLKVVMDWFANQHVSKDSQICRDHPERFLYTNVSDGNYGLDENVKIKKGRDVSNLRELIEKGKLLKSKIWEMEASGLALPEEGVIEIEIDGRLIPIRYKLGNENIRERVDGAKTPYRPIIVSPEDALFVVSATDIVFPPKNAPRHRWSSMAQPDLSDPSVITEAIDIGRHWLKSGIDGFRIDSAVAAFPERIRVNWGIETSINLTATFIEKMREIKPDCYFMMDGPGRQRELLALAGNGECSAYSSECSDYATEALMVMDSDRLEALTKYLREPESRTPREMRNNILYAGPEYGTFDFGDSSAMLGYGDRNILYFIHTFLPGYQMVFDGEIFGSQHKYKNDITKTSPAPHLEGADPAKRKARETLFLLSRTYKQLSEGEYQYLETGDLEAGTPQEAIGMARYDKDEIVVGVFNPHRNPGAETFDLKRIIKMQVGPSESESVKYVKESIRLQGDGLTWVTLDAQTLDASTLYKEGLEVNLDAKCCEVIRLRKIRLTESERLAAEQSPGPVNKGSPAKGLRSLWGKNAEDRIFRKSAVTAEAFAKMREYSLTTVRTELNDLVALGLVDVEKRGRTNFYYLSNALARAPPEAANSAVDNILEYLEKDLKDIAKIAQDKISTAKTRVNEILTAIFTEKDVGRILLLLSKLDTKLGANLGANLDESRSYEIRYDKNRIKECPYGAEVLEAYRSLVAKRIGANNRVKLIPYTGEEGLVSVECYKAGMLIGRGSVGVNGRVDLAINPPSLTSILSMAFAEANIRINRAYGEMDDDERGLVAFIKEECKTLTDVDVPEAEVLNFIKDLTAIKVISVNNIEEYNRLTIRKLQQSA